MSGFAATLREFRHDRCPSQGRLAKRIHVDRSAVSRWESDQRMPTVATLARIADALGLTNEQLGELVRSTREDA